MYKEVILKTMTRSDEPNANGVVYTKESFEKMIENAKERIDNRQIKLTCQPRNELTDLYSITSVKNEYVIGDVTKIEDGQINVDVYENKLDLLQQLMNSKYQPAMRYLAHIEKHNKSSNDETSETCKQTSTATNLKIISFDMICNGGKKI